MKATQISTLEKEFVTKSILEGFRVDGRAFEDLRHVDIQFGKEWGHSEVHIGDTKALAQTSCEIVPPNPSRPTEGQIFFNVIMSPLASRSFEPGHQTVAGNEIQRILERVLRECKAVDLESLCIISGEKVWVVKVDINILDHCGNMVDAAVLAAISSLVHFKRPHVEVIGDQVTIHSEEEHVPDPFSIHHRPVCISLACFDDQHIVVDPTDQEEKVCKDQLTIAMNAHEEVCVLHKLGGVALQPDVLLACIRIASEKAAYLSLRLSEALRDDTQRRLGSNNERGPSLKDLKTIKSISKQSEKCETHNIQGTEAVGTHGIKEAMIKTNKGSAELFQGNDSWGDQEG
eukprot:m.339695 g.339695  ORF g.339695 m.339695 type:complete len:345 (+) comp18916_c0_seq1:236-1270(+)